MTTCCCSIPEDQKDHTTSSFLGRVFQRRQRISIWTRKSSSVICSMELSPSDTSNQIPVKKRAPAAVSSTTTESEKTCSHAGLVRSSSERVQASNQKLVKKPIFAPPRHSFSMQGKRVSDPSRNSVSSTSTNSTTTPRSHLQITMYHQYRNHSCDVAPSGNILSLGLAQMNTTKTSSPAGSSSATTPSKLSDLYHHHHHHQINGTTMGNILVNKSYNRIDDIKHQHNTGMDSVLGPDLLNSIGNDKYKNGKFKQALGFYDQAIALDPSKASYRGNRSCALMSLGRILEAVLECREAIRIQPSYHKGHHRLALLYIRLGCAEEALYHFENSENFADLTEISQAQALVTCVGNCRNARTRRDWNSLLRESLVAVSVGADSAPQMYCLQVEALLNLHRHEEAYTVFKKRPNFNISCFSQLFDKHLGVSLYSVEARVYLAVGRFEDAIKAAENAAQIDPNIEGSRELLIRTRAVMVARAMGNKQFNDSSYLEACGSYSQGLDLDPYNSVLLCNRAACRSKLGQFEKAVEDCTLALSLRPSYCKARLRRANCNAKLERWEASIQDYEMVMRETPGNQEVGRSLLEARAELKRKRGGQDVNYKDMKFGSNLVMVSSKECFRHLITSPGMSVALFFNKTSHATLLQLLEPVRKKFPSINFLKVEVATHPYLVKSESITQIPVFMIYKNGWRVEEVPGNNFDLLENSMMLYTT